MTESSYRIDFNCEVSTINGKLHFGSYVAEKDGKSKELNVEPPPIFRSVIFDIMQEYMYYGGQFHIEHTVSYIHLEHPEECDLVCLDVAMLEPEHKIDTKRAIVPAKYNLYFGQKNRGSTYFYGDVYNSIIQADWSNNQPVNLLNRTPLNHHWSQFAGIVDLHFSVLRSQNKFNFAGFFIIRRHVLGEIAGTALIPKYPKENEVPKHAIVASYWQKNKNGELILSLSNEAWSNLNNLGRLLEYRGSQRVWVSGESGSGKEVFAQGLHAGSVISRDKTLKIRSAAGVKLEEFSQRLFSSRISEQCLIEQVDGGGTIFLDEFDKLDKHNIQPICSTLLRVLEADEYIKEVVDSGGIKRESLAKLNKVNWIFAGAFTTTDQRKLPGDFWSRITGRLDITNPILNSRKYAATLFLYFYVSEAIRALGPRYEVNIDNFISLIENEPNKRQFNEQIIANVLGLGESCLGSNDRIVPGELLFGLAKRFADEVEIGDPNNFKARIDSSRGIRQAAKAAFFVMRQSAIEDGEEFEFSEAIKQALKASRGMLKTSRGLFIDSLKVSEPEDDFAEKKTFLSKVKEIIREFLES